MPEDRRGSRPARRRIRLRAPRVVGALALAGVAAAGGALWYYDDGRRAAEHFERGVSMLASEQPAAALVELKNAAALGPDDGAVQFHLARAFLRTGDGEKALQAFDRARDLGFRDPGMEVLRVQAALVQRKYDRALGLIDESEAPPAGERSTLLMLQGEAELGARRPDAAWRAFSRVLDEDPANPEARRGMARVALAEGDPDEAGRQIDKALAAAAGDVQTWVLKGELELATGDVEAAEASFARAVELDGDSAAARSGIVRALLARGEAERAREHVEALAARHPDAVVTRFLQASVARDTGDPARARERLVDVINAAPDHAPSVLLLAEIDLAAGAHEAVVELLGPWIGAHPRSIAARRMMAAALIELREPDQAIGVLRPLEAAGVQDPAVYHLIGTAYAHEREHDISRRYLERARELAPGVGAIEGQIALSHIAAGESSAALDALGEAATDANSRVLRVAALLDEGAHVEAVAAARALVDARPGDARAQNLLGAALEAGGDEAAAREWYARSAHGDAGYLTPRFNLARLDRAAGRLDAARATYAAVIADAPDHAGALVGLALVAAAQGRPQEALDALEHARAANPRALSPRLVLAGFHLRRGGARAALAIAEEAARIDAGDPRVLRALGMSRLANGLADKAVADFHRLAKVQPRSADAQFRLALAYEALGDAATMRKHLERTLALEPDHLLARAGIGNLDLARGDAAAALARAESILADSPAAVAGHLLAGDARSALGRHAEAIAAYREAYALAPGGATMRKLYRGLARAGAHDEALALVREWLATRPGDVGARLLLAGLLEGSGREELAILEYERVLYEHPEHAAALNNLAWLYHRRGDPRALETAERAYARAPDHPQIADTYGWMLLRTGRVDEALPIIEAAYERAPADPGIRFHRAAAFATTGRGARARDELEALLDAAGAFPEREQAQALLARLR